MLVCIAGFTAMYLYDVKKERKNSIARYSGNPKLGDIYKMQEETREDGAVVYYLKIKDIGAESIYFYPSRMRAGVIDDILLKSYDTSSYSTRVYSKKELSEIVAGKWMIPDKNKLQLLEIERK
jgi:hypothetical protein